MLKNIMTNFRTLCVFWSIFELYNKNKVSLFIYMSLFRTRYKMSRHQSFYIENIPILEINLYRVPLRLFSKFYSFCKFNIVSNLKYLFFEYKSKVH